MTGALAGVAASYAMTKFQAILSATNAAPGGGDDDPATVKAAQRAAPRPIPKPSKPAAGEAVHYAFGALLGAMYGAGSEYVPAFAAGGGMPFGVAVALVADEMAVPAVGLSGPSWQSPFSSHAYPVASHTVFGPVLDAACGVLSRV